MINNTVQLFKKLICCVTEAGAYRASVINVAEIETEPEFRKMCESNVCGNYGKCWMCPPDIGDIGTLAAKIREYDYALVYQTVGNLEDSYDFEGMMEAAELHNQLMQRLTEIFPESDYSNVLHLGAGGCRYCGVCAKEENLPCRHPDLARSSLEAYGINVSRLAAACGINYINGQNTVTYFGAVFFTI